MKNENRHNGWANYATWRINLELLDGHNPIDEDDTRTAYEIGKAFKEAVEDILEHTPELAMAYALAFLDDVDWRELAQSKLDEHSNG